MPQVTKLRMLLHTLLHTWTLSTLVQGCTVRIVLINCLASHCSALHVHSWIYASNWTTNLHPRSTSMSSRPCLDNSNGSKAYSVRCCKLSEEDLLLSWISLRLTCMAEVVLSPCWTCSARSSKSITGACTKMASAPSCQPCV